MGVFVVGRQVGLEILMPGWWISGASIDMDFRNSRYFDTANPNTVSLATDFLSCTRASTGYAKNSSGTWISFASNQLRITDLGLLIEDARTNNLLNSSAPATQTTASLATGNYTLWVEGSGSALASAGSATITGAASATENNPDTFTVTVAGTVTVTVTGSLTKFQLELGNFPSSFILTTGAAATRAADAINVIGNLNTLLSSVPRSDLVDVRMNLPPASTMYIVTDISGNPADLALVSSDTVITSVFGGAFNATFGTGLFSTGVKVAVGVASGAFSLVGGGGTVTTGAAGSAMTSGNGYFGSTTPSGYMFGYIRRATFWNSKLADATLQALTAP